MSTLSRSWILLLLGIILAGCGSNAPVPAANPQQPSNLVLLQQSEEGQQESAATKPTAVVAATLLGVSQKTQVLGDSKEWPEVHEWLHGLKIQTLPLDRQRTGRGLKLEIKSAGLIVVAAAWTPALPGHPSEVVKWREACESNAKLGWESIGAMVYLTGKTPQEYVIFRRQVTPGEQLDFVTGTFSLPQLIVLDSQHTQEIAAREAAIVEPGASTHHTILATLPATGGSLPGGPLLTLRARDAAPDVITAPLLQRELVRQALLLAAREELGLLTRDESLNETFPAIADQDYAPLDVIVTQNTWLTKLEAMVIQRGKHSHQIHWQKTLDLLPDYPRQIESLASYGAGWSSGEFPELLQKLGWKSRLVEKAGPAQLPSGCEARLLNLNVISQLGLVRELHQQLRAHQATPEVLFALSRAYANLHLLTDELWSPAYYVYAARALLYCERGVRLKPDSLTILWNRAYVRALIGRHATALEDLHVARIEREVNPDGALHLPQPDWVPLLRSFCELQIDELVIAERNPRLAMFAGALLIQTAPNKWGDERITAAAVRLHERFPLYPRAWLTLYRSDLLGVQHELRASSLPMSVALIREGLREWPDLPAEIHQFCQSDADDNTPEVWREWFSPEGELARELQQWEQDENSGEIGGSALRGLIRDLVLRIVMSNLSFETNSLGIPADESLAELRPLVSDHRYADVLDIFSSDKQRQQATAKKLADTLQLQHFERNAESVYFLIQEYFRQDPRLKQYWEIRQQHNDHIYRDLCDILVRPGGGNWSYFARGTIGVVSPHSPMRAYAEANIAYQVPVDALYWERIYEDHPLLQMALGDMYSRFREFDSAARCYRRQLQIDHSITAYEKLLSLHWEQKQWDQLKGLLTVALQEDFGPGLAASRIKTWQAALLMREKKWDAAWTYAEEAASTGSHAGLLSAARCPEGLEQWDEAEKYMQAISYRYEHAGPNWFFWCVRTGRGNKDAALNLARQYARLHEADPDPGAVYNRIMLSLLLEDFETAFRTSSAAADYQGSYRLGFQSLALAQYLGKRAERDRWINQAFSYKLRLVNNKTDGLALHNFAGNIVDLLKNGPSAWPTATALDDLFQELPSYDADFVRYHLALIAWSQDERERAQKLMSDIGERERDSDLSILAAEFLKQKGLPLLPLPPEPVGNPPQAAQKAP